MPRDDGLVHVRFTGDYTVAKGHLGLARQLLWRLQNTMGGADVRHTLRLPDGTVVHVEHTSVKTAISIDATAAQRAPEPVEVTLNGFGCMPLASTMAFGYNDPATTKDHNEAVLAPQLDSSDDPIYLTYLYNGAHRPADAPPEFRFKIYARRFKDTDLIEMIPWYPDPEGIKYGNIDWKGPDGEVLSWHGPRNRYSDLIVMQGSYMTAPEAPFIPGTVASHSNGSFRTSRLITRLKQAVPDGTTITNANIDSYAEYFEMSTQASGNLFCNGRRVTGVNGMVTGAALHKDAAGTRLCAVLISGQYGPPSSPANGAGHVVTEEEVWIYNLNTDTAKATDGQLIHTITYMTLSSGDTSTTCFNTAPWLFNASGTEAVSARRTGPSVFPELWDLSVTWTPTGGSATDGSAGDAATRRTVTNDSGMTVNNTDVHWTQYIDSGGVCTPQDNVFSYASSWSQDQDSTITDTYYFRDYAGDTLITGTIVQEVVAETSVSGTGTPQTCSRSSPGVCSGSHPTYDESVLGSQSLSASASGSGSTTLTIDGDVIYTDDFTYSTSSSSTNTRVSCSPSSQFSHSGTGILDPAFAATLDLEVMDMRDKSPVIRTRHEESSPLAYTLGTPVDRTIDRTRAIKLYRQGTQVETQTADDSFTSGGYDGSNPDSGPAVPTPSPPSSVDVTDAIEIQGPFLSPGGVVGEHSWLLVGVPEVYAAMSDYKYDFLGTLHRHTYLTNADPAVQTGLVGTDPRYTFIGLI